MLNVIRRSLSHLQSGCGVPFLQPAGHRIWPRTRDLGGWSWTWRDDCTWPHNVEARLGAYWRSWLGPCEQKSWGRGSLPLYAWPRSWRQTWCWPPWGWQRLVSSDWNLTWHRWQLSARSLIDTDVIIIITNVSVLLPLHVVNTTPIDYFTNITITIEHAVYHVLSPQLSAPNWVRLVTDWVSWLTWWWWWRYEAPLVVTTALPGAGHHCATPATGETLFLWLLYTIYIIGSLVRKCVKLVPWW